MPPVRYTPDVEHLLEHEQQTIDDIARAVTDVAAHVAEKHGHAMRATHAKATGFAKGELTVLGGLPSELAQGLFARPGRYDVLVRYSQGPSEPLSDQASGQRGMAVKVLGVVAPGLGPRVRESREATTQDFVLAPDPAFINRTAATFRTNFGLGAGKSTYVPEAAIVVGSKVARAAEAGLEAVGLKSANLKFFGRPPLHPLSHPYYTQVPVRYGDYIAKLAAYPTDATLAAVGDPAVDAAHDDNAFRHALVATLAGHGAEFDVRAQLCTDLATMPVEDAVPEWPEDQSPYRTVARLTIPAQDAYSEARRRYFDERLAFNPWHALAAHRPLGSVNRARLKPYEAAQDLRQRQNGVRPAEPRSLAEVPD